jgi:oligopeptide transport system substrate-binding protein
VLVRVPSFDLPRLRQRGVVRTDPFLATYFLGFNLRKPPFDRVEWRRAVSAVIRRAELTTALGGGEAPAAGWIPPGLAGHRPYADPLDSADSATAPARSAVEAVRRAVRAGRGPRGAIAVQFDAGARNAMILEKVQADLKRELGIEVALVRHDWKTHVRAMGTDPAPIFRYGWLAAFADPVAHLRPFQSGEPNNYGGWRSPRYDRLYAEISRLAPGPEREAKVREADRLLVLDEAAVAPLFHYVQVHAVAPRVRGFRVNPFGVIRFEELSLR